MASLKSIITIFNLDGQILIFIENESIHSSGIIVDYSTSFMEQVDEY